MKRNSVKSDSRESFNLVIGLAVAWMMIRFISLPCTAQELTARECARIDSSVLGILERTGAPGASLAIVRGGVIVYEHAYGDARIHPKTDATPSMRYAIGSVSKQFTATALLLLCEEGKLSLDDKVTKWFPWLTRASEVSVRQLLSMTSGYQDYWPQDYVFPDMLRPVTAKEIMQRWATRALDFDPGTRWQYSNTNYVIVGSIIELLSGIPFMEFLQQHIFTPLHMKTVADFDKGSLDHTDAGGYLRNGLGPLRPAPKEAPGWLFGAGQLAMTAHDLAVWDLSVVNRSLLKPESYEVQQKEILLADGTPTGYGLGINVGKQDGLRLISHGGAVSGYTTANLVYPDERAAIVVFTNIYPGAPDAPGKIANSISKIILQKKDTAGTAVLEKVKRIYEGLSRGAIDRALFTPAANAYFSGEVLSDYAASLAPLGPPAEFSLRGKYLRGGLMIRNYFIRAGSTRMELSMMELPGGLIDQYIISRAD